MYLHGQINPLPIHLRSRYTRHSPQIPRHRLVPRFCIFLERDTTVITRVFFGQSVLSQYNLHLEDWTNAGEWVYDPRVTLVRLEKKAATVG